MATLESRIADLITEVGYDVKRALPFYLPFGRPGTLATFTSPRIYFPDDVQLMGAVFSLTTAPTGSSAIFEVLKNGSGTFSSDPTISASGFRSSDGTLTGATVIDASGLDYLQINCSQVGSTIAGADLTAVLKLILS